MRIFCYILFIYLFIYFLLIHKFKATRKLTTGKSQLASDISSHYPWFLEKFVNFISTCTNFVLITILFLIQVPSCINAGKEISLRNSINFANKLKFDFLHKMWLYQSIWTWWGNFPKMKLWTLLSPLKIILGTESVSTEIILYLLVTLNRKKKK